MFPSSSDLVNLFDEKTREWFAHLSEKSSTLSSDDFIGKIIALHHCNFFQWIEEDKAHSTHCEESEIAHLKKEIDASNLRRSHLIDEIDSYFFFTLKITRTDNWNNLYINSQTLGEIMDKLSVLCLKRFFIGVKSKTSCQSEGDHNRKAERIEELIEYVSECYDRFIKHLQEGKGYMPFGQLKLYGAQGEN
jgi:hypothetical protein